VQQGEEEKKNSWRVSSIEYPELNPPRRISLLLRRTLADSPKAEESVDSSVERL